MLPNIILCDRIIVPQQVNNITAKGGLNILSKERFL